MNLTAVEIFVSFFFFLKKPCAAAERNKESLFLSFFWTLCSRLRKHVMREGSLEGFI
jgi:hypothetical protein